MATLENLPADQRAVLQLVLQRGRSYDEIARLLSIDRSAVRQRATGALNALGPQTGLPDERREVITDYLLGQLDPSAAAAAHDEMAAAPGERAWARVVASELVPLANGPLPEIPAAAAPAPPPRAPAPPVIAGPPPVAAAPPSLPPPVAPPVGSPAAGAPPPAAPPAPPEAGKRKRESVLLRRSRRKEAAAAAGAVAAYGAAASPDPASAGEPRAKPETGTPEPEAGKPKRESVLLRRSRRNQATAAAGDSVASAPGTGGSGPGPGGSAARSDASASGSGGSASGSGGSGEEAPGRSSLLGGMVLIVLTVVIVAAVAVILLNSGGSSPSHAASASSTTPAISSTATAPAAAASTTASSASAAKPIAQINLTPPTATSNAAGIAEVLKQGVNKGIAIVAQHVTPNTTKPPNAYAVWLYNSAADAHLLGFVNPGVAANGKLQTAGGLPANAAHYKQLIVTVETKASPKTPGSIILQGKLTLGP